MPSKGAATVLYNEPYNVCCGYKRVIRLEFLKPLRAEYSRKLIGWIVQVYRLLWRTPILQLRSRARYRIFSFSGRLKGTSNLIYDRRCERIQEKSMEDGRYTKLVYFRF